MNIKIKLASGICVYYRWEKDPFCFDRACTARGEKAATKPAGPGFDGSEAATRWKGIK